LSILVLHRKNLSRRRHLDRARQCARDNGQRLILIMKDPTWEKEYVDQVVVADTSSIDDTLVAGRGLVEPVDAVLTFAEAPVPAVARVAADLGLPAVPERTAFLARDKYAMRTAVGQVTPGVTLPNIVPRDEVRELRSVADCVNGYVIVSGKDADDAVARGDEAIGRVRFETR